MAFVSTQRKVVGLELYVYVISCVYMYFLYIHAYTHVKQDTVAYQSNM